MANNDINILIKLNNSSFLTHMHEVNDALKKGTDKLREMGETMRKTGAAFTAAGGAVVASLGLAVKGFANAADAADDTAKRTGLTVQAVQELDYIARLTGSSLGAVESALRRMQASTFDAANGVQMSADAFRALGVNVGELQNLSAEDQFYKLLAALSGIPDAGTRAALAMDVFGRSGTALLPMVAEGARGIETLRAKAHQLGFVMSQEMATAGSAFNDSWDDVKLALSGVSNVIGASLAPLLAELNEKLAAGLAKIKDFAAAHPVLTKNVTIAAAVLGTLSLAFGALLVVLGQLIIMAPAMATAWALITGPVGLAAAAIAGVVAASVWLATCWDDLSLKTKILLGVLAPMVVLPIALWKNWNTVLYGLQQGFGMVKIAVMSMAAAVLERFASLLKNVPVLGARLRQEAKNLNEQIEAESKALAKRQEQHRQEQAARKKKEDEQAAQDKMQALSAQASAVKTKTEEEKKYEKELLDYRISVNEATLQDKLDYLNSELSSVQKNTSAELAILKERQSVLSQISDEQQRQTDARYNYEKTQLFKWSKEEQTLWHEQQLKLVNDRLSAAQVGGEEYYKLLKKQAEEINALQELSNFNFIDGVTNALEEVSNEQYNWKDGVVGVLHDVRDGLTDTFNTAFQSIGKGWEEFGDAVKNFGQKVLDSFTNMLAEMAAQWVMKHVIMNAATQAWAALKTALGIKTAATEVATRTETLAVTKALDQADIASSASVGAARAAAASAWSVWGAIGIGMAIGAAIMAFAGAFAKGGIVPGNNFSGDNMIARVNSGEAILNKTQQQNILMAVADGRAPAAETAGGGVIINQTNHITAGGSESAVEAVLEGVKRGTAEALEMANAVVKAGNRRGRLAV